MPQSKRHSLLIGLTLSVILSLFVNFSLLMRSYQESSHNIPVMDFEHFYLYFSLLWFFIFSLSVYLLTTEIYHLGDRYLKKNGFRLTIIAILINCVFTGGALLVYPFAEQTIIHNLLDENLRFNQDSTATARMDTIEIQSNQIPIRQGQILTPRDTKPPFPDLRTPREKDLDQPILPDMMRRLPFFFNHGRDMIPGSFLTEHIFTMLTIILTITLFRLIVGKQQMQLEYEKLKTEKLQTSYNALMGQINPHFFFNSLNGLNSLIREGEQEKTLTYLDELSNVFRYILQSNHKEMVTLAEELDFVKAYTYLLQVRYEGKLFFNISADPKYLLWYIPILSVLPLVENAVKHNVISKQYPLRIDIATNLEDELTVSNHIQPKVDDPKGSGIGLKNLWGRFKLLTGKDIKISDRKEYFVVSLPLLSQPIKKV